jgi:hypothetical protein
VKNHDFTPKNHIFSIAEGGAKIFEVFRVKNHDFTPKNHISSNFRGRGGGGGDKLKTKRKQGYSNLPFSVSAMLGCR